MHPSGRRFATVLFDWDGTLLDSAHLGLLAFRATFRELGIPFPEESYRTIYTPNWYSMYETLGVPRESWERADSLWLAHYGDEPPELVQGALEALAGLAAKGYRMGVVSSGSESRVRREILCLNLSGYFEVVICNEDTRNKKPHPEGLELALAALGCAPGECCYVGDSPEDIAMGKTAGVFTIGIPGGYPGGVRLPAACPDLLLSSAGELLSHL